MSVDQLIKIPQANDKVTIDFINKINELLKTHNLVPTVKLNILGVGTIDLDESENKDILDRININNSNLIYQLSISVSNFYIGIYRGGSREPKSPYSNDLILRGDNYGSLSNNIKISILQIINDTFLPFSNGRSVGKFESQDQQDLVSIHESTLTRLEGVNENLILTTHNYRNELDSKFELKLKELEKIKEEQLNHIELRRKSVEEAIQKKESDLEERIKELDNKSNTHARRQIRKDILKEIKHRQTDFGLTNGTNGLRTPVARAIMGLMIFLTLFVGFSTVDLYDALRGSNDIKLWIAVAKQVAFTSALVLTVFYYIKWQNRWFEQHSQAEFKLKQLELDMERASWLVETSLEWNDVKGSTLPNELMQSLSRNLFSENSDDAEDVIHPADQLASALMGSASLVRLKAGDSEIHIDPKKLKKSRKEIQSDD